MRSGSGKSISAANRKLAERVQEYEAGLTPASQHRRVKEAVEDWPDHGQGDADESTVKRYRGLCKNLVIPKLGGRKLRDLRPREVEEWLEKIAEDLASSSVTLTKWRLSKSITRAMKHGLVDRNVVDLCDTLRGRRPGRPSKSMTMEQAEQMLHLTYGRPMHCYSVLSLVTGARTEELRPLRWEHVHLDASPP